MLDRRSISNQEIETYERDGVVCLRGLLTPADLAMLEEAIAENAASPTPRAKDTGEGKGRFYNDYNVWRHSPAFRAFLAESRLAEAAAALLRSNAVNLYGDHLLVKSAGSDIRTEWHQDMPFWLVDGEPVGSFWMALGPVSRDTGALQFVRGSHRSGTLYNPVGGSVGHTRFAGHEDIPDIDAATGEHDVISFDLEPGDCTFHHSRMLHAASGNANPDRPRQAYAVRVAGDGAVYRFKQSSRDVLPDPVPSDGAPLSGAFYPRLWPEPEFAD